MSILYLSTVYPLPHKIVNSFMQKVDSVSIAEGPYPVIELQISERQKVRKRADSGKKRPGKEKEETMFGFKVVRDSLGPGSAINMAHGITKLDPAKRVLALTQEDLFFHSGMPAFVNTLYNNSAYVLLIMTNKKEQEIESVLKGFGFHNFRHIDNLAEIETFRRNKDLTVLFYKGII
jgi:TPP-dependent indolepyruvate ferredoxin oxidoreductase alpha subunit